jgi:adenylate cyclase
LLNSKLQQLIDKTLLDDAKRHISAMSSIVAVPAFLSFWIADLLYVPEQKMTFLFLRLLILPLVFIMKKMLSKMNTYSHAQMYMVIYAVFSGSIINVMIYLIDDITTPYYAGLNLVALLALALMPLKRVFWTITLLGIYLPYFIFLALKANLLNGFQFNADSLSNLTLPIINLFFIVGTVILCLFIRWVLSNSRDKEIRAQLELENELELRADIIKIQSDEATKLNMLSSQFSPQVVKAIKDGTINLEGSNQQSEICAVFIDIVKSTNHINKLHYTDTQLVLEKFLDTCLTTFLKYDLTIDKFHGDGVLAYSNMPIKRPDFIQRAAEASLETLELIAKDSEFYKKHWKEQLQVRIGLSVGLANVGFYGSAKFFKTFTAIGSTLAYASRLTSLAQPNQILVDFVAYDYLFKNNYTLSHHSEPVLKGFESDVKPVYSLTSSPLLNKRLAFHKTCPTHIDTVLHLEENSDSKLTLKCRNCDYVEL